MLGQRGDAVALLTAQFCQGIRQFMHASKGFTKGTAMSWIITRYRDYLGIGVDLLGELHERGNSESIVHHLA